MAFQPFVEITDLPWQPIVEIVPSEDGRVVEIIVPVNEATLLELQDYVGQRLAALTLDDLTFLQALFDERPTTTAMIAAIAKALESSVSTQDYAGAIAAGAVVAPIAANPSRQLLVISNTGPNALANRFDADPTATAGHGLAPGETKTFDDKCPVGALRLFSQGGTTFFATAG